MISSLTEGIVVEPCETNTFGNVNRLTLTFAFEPLQPVTPLGQGFVDWRRLCTPLNAHWNSVSPPQLLSTVAIDPVESRMIATFHGCDEPCMDAVAVAPSERVLTPNKAIKYVLIVVLFLTTTAFGEEPEPH